MSNPLGDTGNTSATAELEIINKKRAALQALVKITTTLNRLHQGLQSVILMGRSASEIPGKVIEKFQSLREKLDTQPTDKLKNTLSSTEHKIQSDIKRVLEISQKSSEQLGRHLNEGDSILTSLDENVDAYVNDFKKKGQTSIALRIALKTRHIILNAFNLPVPVTVIETQISVLDKREMQCREKINHDIDDIQSDISNLIAKEDCPDELKNQLTEIAVNLSANKAHIGAGKQIEEMPILYESIELAADAEAVYEIEQQSLTTEAAAPEIITEKKTKLSFFNRVWLWMRSPINVKWKDIDKFK